MSSPTYCLSLLDTTEAQILKTGAIREADQIRYHSESLLSFNQSQRKITSFLQIVGSQGSFKERKSELCANVVFFGSFSPQQAATTSHPALAYFAAVHIIRHNPRQDKNTQKSSSNKEKIQTATRFGTDMSFFQQ
ncbi:hypothetical protein XENORESO_012563 [Xenotaenia resolanae]|uniref:Uncharacterized protein n=1 Tax=Xenotaenia resolanae TaxID=208358 RepID=A0ABV0WM47_9TELE